MPRLLVMVLADLRQQVLDKSFFIFGLIVPLALMGVFNLVFSGISEELEPITVAVSAPEGDQMAAVVPQVLDEIDGEGLDVTLREGSTGQVEQWVSDGEVGAGVVLPDGFMSDVIAGGEPEVIVHIGQDTGLEADVVTSVVSNLLDQVTAGARTSTAAVELGATPAQLGELAQGFANTEPSVTWTEGETASEQLSAQGSVVAGQAGFFLLFTVGFGVLGLLIEREWGTLARLTSMPIPSWFIVLSKGLSSFVLGVTATAVLLTAGTIFFGDVDFGSPVAIGGLLILVVAAAVSIMFVVAKVARSAEQAGIAQAIVAITLGMAGGAFIPGATASGWVGQVLQLNPVAALTRGLGITAGGGGIADLGPIALTMTLFTAAMLAIAVLVPGRKDAL